MTRIAVGKIVNVHGIKGVMKFQPALTSAPLLSRLNPLSDKEGKKHFEMTLVGKKGSFWLVSAKGISDRTTAEKFKGMELFAEREKFPEIAEGEFYCCDLMGLDVMVDGVPFGVVINVPNYGAGVILEIKTNTGKTLDLPFSKRIFPKVDIEHHQIELILPDEMKEVEL
ncbi:MAG: ribosome maturation factor RimM [Alphaproteobacteria bacterium]